MGNSFNTSLAPEIAALDAKVVIVDSVADAIRATDVPNIQTNINANETKIDANKAVIDNIHDTDLPATKAVADAILAAPVHSIYPNNAEVLAGDTERANTNSSTFAKVKEFLVSVPGTYRITFDIKTLFTASTAHGTIYKNGVAFGTAQTTTSESYVNKSEDLIFSTGDLIQLYTKCSSANPFCYIRNFKLKGIFSDIRNLLILD